MGPDPFNMPGAGAAGNNAALQQTVNQLAPYATSWHGPTGGAQIPQIAPDAYAGSASSSSGGALSKFAHFLGGVGSEIGHVAGGAATWLAHNATTMVEAPFKFVGSVDSAFKDNSSINQINAQNQQFTAKLDTLNRQFKAGQISSDEFKAALKSLNQETDDLSKQASLLDNKVATDKQNATTNTINTVADALLFLGPELGVVPAAAKGFLFADAAAPALESVAERIGGLAINKSLFDGLSDAAKLAIQRPVAEVVANSAGKTATDIAKSAAINLALKQPIYFNYLSSTGADIYKELDNKKYGSAIQTIAFNAALLLSGGPIGQALKYGGKTIAGITGKVFGRTAFIDALSRGIGNGDPAGLFNAIDKLPADEKSDVVKQMAAVEATNLNAVGGKDAAAAALRVLQGMENYEGLSMSNFTHEEALSNMVNFAKAQRVADEAGKAAGLGPITVGRIDARTLGNITESLVNAGSPEDRLKAWDMLKQTAPNAAWANNENFDSQIKTLINRYENPSDLAAAIGRIKASFSVAGFPQSVARQLEKMGYIPIKPMNLEAPFKEGGSRLASAFGKNDDFFTKAVQPLPILGSLGAALTTLGLSPYASTQRVYQIFNDNLSQNLKGLVPDIMGEDAATTTDTMIKRLSSYARNPTHGRLISKAPITDLRMLTNKDIQAALDVSGSDARDIQHAIAQSFLQVPLAVRGLGDRVVDRSYQLAGPLQRRYLRVLGATRFSWNPFFQYLRVVPKTEMLASFEGGGFVNSVFTGKLQRVNAIRNSLRAQGLLDEVGHLGQTMSQDAAEFAGAGGRNLSKKLLPAQEKSIAGLIGAQADRMGLDWKEYVKQYPEQVRDTIQSIAQYDRHGDFLNSPLLRTLNIAFFPARFDTKVAQIMAKGLSRTSLMTQVSVVNGIMRGSEWLNSPEGQAWYSKNSDIIGLLEYVSPVASLNSVFQSLLPGHDHSLGNFGEVGGLPFGWIPQLLDAEGLTHFNQSGVNPKTGAVYSTYVPLTQRGQLAVAIQDLLTQLFSYPGATVGLPSKATITRTLALGFVGGSKKVDLQSNTPAASSLSPQQQDYSSLIQSLSQTSAQSPGQSSPSALRPAISVPNTSTGEPSNKGPATAKASKAAKKKKADFTPALLPGQSTLGQL